LNYLEIISYFEDQIKEKSKYELLEMHYAPYSFGSGFRTYRINGKIIKIIYNGKENLVELKISNRHEKYPLNSWKSFSLGDVNDFIDKGIIQMKDELKG